MKTRNNIGNWIATCRTDGKALQLIVKGSFSTNGEKPFYHLIKNEPQGINPQELILTLAFGFLVVENGSSSSSTSYTEIINTDDQYKSILILDDSEEPRTLANISIIDNKHIDNETYSPQLEILMGFEITDSKLKIRTYTGGCTTKESFKIEIIKGFTGEPPYIIEIYRVIPDYCKGLFREGILFEYELTELGIKSSDVFSLTNKVGQIR